MSPLKNALTILIKTLTPIFKLFSDYASHFMAVIGLISIVIGGTFRLPEEYSKIFTSIGSAVLVGGVFGVLLKSAQYVTIFDGILREIIYGNNKPDCDLLSAVRSAVHENRILQQQKDLKDLWKTISVAVYKTRYPEISEAIAKKVTQEYFPNYDTFYYERFVEDITSLELSPDNKYVETKETLTMRVKPIDSSQPTNWRYVARLFKGQDDSRTKFFLDKITVDGIDKTDGCLTPPKDVVGADGRLALEADMKLELAGASSYNLKLEIRRIYDYERNRQRDMKSSRFIINPEFRVRFNPKVWELKFAPVGTDEKIYENKARSFSDLIWNVYEDLIFPNQGYTLLLYRKEAPPMSKDTIRV